MSELPHHSRPGHARLLTLAAALCALGCLLGGATARGSALGTDPREIPTIQVSVDPSSATTTDTVTLTATITATSGFPDGTVKFATIANPNDAIADQTALPVEAVSGLQAKAQLSTTFGQGTYQIVAYWTPSTSSSFTMQPVDSTGDPHTLDVSGSTPAATPTHITLDLSPPPPILPGTLETLTARVTADSGPTPTGGQVHFYDGVQALKLPVTLEDGVATLTVDSFGAGPHALTASYDGNSPSWAGSQTDAANNQANTFSVPSTAPQATTTHTTLSPPTSPIRVGDTIDLTAHVVQDGAAAPPVGGEVYFYSDANCHDGVLGQPVQLGTDGTATLTHVGNWAVGDYTLCASYVGNTYNTDTPGLASLSVIPQVSPTALTLTGPSSAIYGTTASFAATLSDTSGPVVGKYVTIQFGSQFCKQKTDASGTSTCSFPSTDPSVDTVTANFAGDLVDPTANAQHGFEVVPAPTTLTVAMNGPTELRGTLVEADGGAPIPGAVLHLSLGDHSCTTNGTDASGLASCTIDPLDASSATLAGSFDGDARYGGDTFSRDVDVPTTVPTTVTYTGPASSDYGDPVTFAAHVSAGTAAVAGPVTFTLGTQTCSTTAGSDGSAACTMTIDQRAGASYTVATHFGGNGVYLASDAADAPFTVDAEESTLTLTAPATVTAGTALHLTASLKGDGSSLAGRQISFLVGSTPACAPTTDANGLASCDVNATGSGSTPISVSFTSDGYYADASASGNTLVQLTTHVAYTGATSADYGDTVKLKAHFTTQDGSVPAGAAVTFRVGAQQCNATVDATSNDAMCAIPRLTDGTATTVEASYSGSSDNVYLTSDDSKPFTVDQEETTLSLTAPGTAQTGSTVNVSAKLLEDGTLAIDDRPIVFKYGSRTCTSAPTSDGVASCQFPASELGAVTIEASFAGDTLYAASDASSQTLYVYAPTPGGGMFVVGDNSPHQVGAGAAFWGSQWWKQNRLSGGPAPSSFKGYALHGTTTCGGAWSTDPGNSTPPPAAPLPGYIAVIVADSASKSGAAISGTTLHVVVVKTAAYDANPGHIGTGTVVATIC